MNIEKQRQALEKLNSDIVSEDDICHDSLQFIIDGLSGRDDVAYGEYHLFIYELEKIMFSAYCNVYNDERFTASDYFPVASLAQKTEAILKAKGLWVAE